MKNSILIRRAQPGDQPDWLRMRCQLWPDGSPAEHAAEMAELLLEPDQPVFLALRPAGHACGFLEGGIRKYADGCDSGPVGYIEGWYVDEEFRRQGVGGRLVEALEAWARERGLSEIASDTWLDNQTSIDAHLRLGYRETERLVHFAKKL
jgi:aminoglycoside 6'-N-acetyltransferase I